MTKTLCEHKKELKHHLNSYIELVCPPNFVCTKCGRVANKDKYLCHAQAICELKGNRPEREFERAVGLPKL